jgi:hypothetical protein
MRDEPESHATEAARRLAGPVRQRVWRAQPRGGAPLRRQAGFTRGGAGRKKTP